MGIESPGCFPPFISLRKEYKEMLSANGGSDVFVLVKVILQLKFGLPWRSVPKLGRHRGPESA